MGTIPIMIPNSLAFILRYASNLTTYLSVLCDSNTACTVPAITSFDFLIFPALLESKWHKPLIRAKSTRELSSIAARSLFERSDRKGVWQKWAKTLEGRSGKDRY